MIAKSKHVRYLWEDRHAATLSPAERLVYRSNILGADPRITNTGGGNTSAKLSETDPANGESVEVLWVKGSGGDLRTSTLVNFASLYQDKLVALQSQYSGDDDAMAAEYPRFTFNRNPRAPSIDTPLHSFVPHRHVDHMHPNAVIAIAAARRSRELTSEVFGDEVGWTPWLRPGFALGVELQRRCREEPTLVGMVLGQHGLINWADDDRDCYELTLRLINRAATFIEARDKGELTFGGTLFHASLPQAAREAILLEILPWLRERVFSGNRCIATVESSPVVLRFVNSHDAPRLAELGTSCPDHFLRTKVKPLYVSWDPSTQDVSALRRLLEHGLEQYRREYAAYYERCRRADSPAMRDPNARVLLIPGIGMIAWGKNKSESRITAEFYNCAIEVMRGTEAIDEYVALPEQEAFDVEYWSLEEAKLQRMPAEKELERCVVLSAGAADTNRLVAAGAHIAGTLEEAVLEYGGIDYVCNTPMAEKLAADARHRLGTPQSPTVLR